MFSFLIIRTLQNLPFPAINKSIKMRMIYFCNNKKLSKYKTEIPAIKDHITIHHWQFLPSEFPPI